MTDHWQINRVQLKAFKSFGPAGCTFDVPSHLVGIVGPNGCGKSNLLEVGLLPTPWPSVPAGMLGAGMLSWAFMGLQQLHFTHSP